SGGRLPGGARSDEPRPAADAARLHPVMGTLMAERAVTAEARPDAVTFVVAPPGLDGIHEFTLRTLSDEGALFSLTAAGEDSSFPAGVAPRLFLIHPGLYFTDYNPTFGAETLATLGAPGSPS